MHHANISQKHFSNFACILHPNTFPEKANPFLSIYFSIWRCANFATLPKYFDECVSTNVSQLHTFIEI